MPPEILSPDTAVDIGEGHYYRLNRNPDGILHGLTLEHPAGPHIDIPGESQNYPGRCLGNITFKPSDPERGWTIESVAPLTISPSIACGCGDHGWIRDGKWVVA